MADEQIKDMIDQIWSVTYVESPIETAQASERASVTESETTSFIS